MFANFLLCYRETPSTNIEKIADRWLAPLRDLWGGKRITVIQNNIVYIRELSADARKTAKKMLAVVLLSAAIFAGALLKAVCFKEMDFRRVYSREIAQCNPELEKIYQLVHFTRQFIDDSKHCFGLILYKPLGTYECSCMANDAFHRFLSPRRIRLENAIVERLRKIDVAEPIRLLSMGSGGMMSECLILSQLVLAGYKQITIDCVDPIGIDADIIAKMTGYLGTGVTIKEYKWIEEIPAENVGYDAIVAIDYDDFVGKGDKVRAAAGGLMNAFQRLSTQGFLALGYGAHEDLLIGLNSVTRLDEKSITAALSADIAQCLPAKDCLCIGISHIDFVVTSLFLAIKLAGKSYRNISLICLRDCSTQVNHCFSFCKMAKAFFNDTVVECDFNPAQPVKCDLVFTGELEKDYRSGTYLQYADLGSSIYFLQSQGPIMRWSPGKEDQKVAVT